MELRRFHPDMAPELAPIWYEGWHQTHPDLVPNELTALRTLDSFQHRLAQHPENDGVVLWDQAYLGMCLWRGNELYQLFVAKAAQGRRLAPKLVDYCLDQLRNQGHQKAVLDCAIGNTLAMGFYERYGWANTGAFDTVLDTSDGPFTMPCYLYEFEL